MQTQNMPPILHNAPIQCLVAVGGHPFDRTRFDSLFQSFEGICATIVEQPAAAQLMNPQGLAGFAVLVLYDMPGLDFTVTSGRPAYVQPTDTLKSGMRALLDQGVGILALHHALAGWPCWQEYAEWLGGRFLYHPGSLRNRHCLDSGYAPEVAYEARIVAEHPVTTGLPETFPMLDELYLAEVFEAEVTALISSSATFSAEYFYSANAAVAGRMNDRRDWNHPPGSNLIGWTRRCFNSNIVYLQPGDGPCTYNNPHYRRLIENSIRWLAAP